MIQRFFIIILLVLFVETIVGQKISKIKLIYGWENTRLPVSATCTPESFSFCFGDEINFLTTYDNTFLEQFKKIYIELSPKDANDSIQIIDPRIMSIITYKDNIPNDTVCFDEFNGICKNGILMKDNNHLLNLVKMKIGWKNNIVDFFKSE